MTTGKTGHDPLIGQALGHYSILDKIGSGGMGVVYRARDEHLGREVAIKILRQQTIRDEHARKLLHKEAVALSKLNHPNIATIHDFDTQQGLDFLVMEYVDGKALSTKLAASALSEKQIGALGLQIALALEEAHEHGIIHRDLKPANISITPKGQVKVLDFGLAKLFDPARGGLNAETLTQSVDDSRLMGTLPYMAPEQVSGEHIDARTDIYGLGVVLYEMATQQRPFCEQSTLRLFDSILHQSVVAPRALNPRISPELERIILKCLEKEPEERYQSAKELVVDLRHLARDKESEHIPTHFQEASPLTLRGRHKTLLAAAVGVAVILVVALFVLVKTKKNPEAPRIEPSIAVLPFVDLSPEKNQEYFSDGLAEELLNSLAKTQGLRVAARSSAFQFKGKNEDLRIVGQKLNVATVLEGSVRKQDQRVRITAQLIQTSNGFHLWSETYDRNLTDIFAVQEEIARAVASSLSATLLGAKPPSPRPTNFDAYNAYLQGRYFYVRRSEQDVKKAIDYFEQAVRLDPNYAPAWSALSIADSFHVSSFASSRENLRRAREGAARALSLDPSSANAHVALAQIQMYIEWDWAGASDTCRQALALEPGNVQVIQTAAELAGILNHYDEALRLARRAVELDPLDASSYHDLAFHSLGAGRLDEAEAALQKALQLNPGFPWLHTLLSYIYIFRSRPQDALAEAERDTLPPFRLQGLAISNYALGRKHDSDRALAELISKYRADAAFQIAEVYAYRGETDLAFAWLERAYKQGDPGLPYIQGDRFLKDLEHDTRHTALLKKMRLPN